MRALGAIVERRLMGSPSAQLVHRVCVRAAIGGLARARWARLKRGKRSTDYTERGKMSRQLAKYSAQLASFNRLAREGKSELTLPPLCAHRVHQ